MLFFLGSSALLVLTNLTMRITQLSGMLESFSIHRSRFLARQDTDSNSGNGDLFLLVQSKEYVRML